MWRAANTRGRVQLSQGLENEGQTNTRQCGGSATRLERLPLQRIIGDVPVGQAGPLGIHPAHACLAVSQPFSMAPLPPLALEPKASGCSSRRRAKRAAVTLTFSLQAVGSGAQPSRDGGSYSNELLALLQADISRAQGPALPPALERNRPRRPSLHSPHVHIQLQPVGPALALQAQLSDPKKKEGRWSAVPPAAAAAAALVLGAAHAAGTQGHAPSRCCASRVRPADALPPPAAQPAAPKRCAPRCSAAQ